MTTRYELVYRPDKGTATIDRYMDDNYCVTEVSTVVHEREAASAFAQKWGFRVGEWEKRLDVFLVAPLESLRG